MATTYETYTADGVLTNFTVPFPYIERDDVKVYVGGVLKDQNADYSFVSPSVIQFRETPTNGALITIRRMSEPDTRVVDFTDGAVLTESDLDLSATQLFYLIQELKDTLEQMLTGAYTAIDSELLNTVAQQILSSATAEEIQSRISDIDAAGQLLLDEMMARRVIGEVTDDYTAFIVDTDTTLISPTESLAQRFTAIAATGAGNAAAIITEQTARVAADSANASAITALGVTVSGHTSSITTLSSVTATLTGAVDDLGDDVVALEARYGVTLNVNGYITGFTQFNDGDSGTFAIMADKFLVVDPASGGQNPTVVFGISGGVVALQNLVVNGSLIVNGSITYDKLSVSQLSAITADLGTVTAGTITMASAGHIKWGSASAYMTGTGGWQGMDSGTPKWRVGDPAGDYIAFDGTNMIINADVTLPGALVSNDDAGSEIVREDTNGTAGSGFTYGVAHEFRVYGTGTIAVRINAAKVQGGNIAGTNGSVRIVKNGSTVVGSAQTLTGSATEFVWTGIAVDASTDTFQVEVYGGTSSDDFFPFDSYNDSGRVNWTSVRAVWRLGEFI